MNCITVNTDGGISQIYPCDDDPNKMHTLQTFRSDDVERLKRIMERYRPTTIPMIDQETIALIKQYRKEENYGELRTMIKKYTGMDVCCLSKMDEIIAEL